MASSAVTTLVCFLHLHTGLRVQPNTRHSLHPPHFSRAGSSIPRASLVPRERGSASVCLGWRSLFDLRQCGGIGSAYARSLWVAPLQRRRMRAKRWRIGRCGNRFRRPRMIEISRSRSLRTGMSIPWFSRAVAYRTAGSRPRPASGSPSARPIGVRGSQMAKCSAVFCPMGPRVAVLSGINPNRNFRAT